MINGHDLKSLVHHSIQKQEAALANQHKAAFIKPENNLIKKMSVGDLINGKLIMSDTNEWTLLTKEGIKLPVLVEGQVQPNKLASFIVQTLENGIVHLRNTQTTIPLEEKIVKELNLPNTEGMKHFVETAIAKELPLDKQMLLKGYALHKEAAVPLPVLANILEKTSGKIEPLIHLFNQHSKESIDHTIGDLKKILLHPETIEGNKVKESITQDEIATEVLGEKVVQEKLAPEKTIANQVKLLDTLLTQYSKNDSLYDLPSELKLNHNEKEVLKTFMGLTGEGGDISQFDRESILSLNEKLYEHLLKNDNEGIREQVKEGKNVKDLPLFNHQKVIESCLEVAEKMELPKEATTQLKEVAEQVTKHGKMQELGNYFFYPYEVGNHKEKAEIYFFKPKKRQEKNKRDFLAVVALDMPSMGNTELHIHQTEKKIAIDLFLEDEKLAKFVEGKMAYLQEKLVGKGYELYRWQCGVKQHGIGEPINLETEATGEVDFKI